MSTTRLASLCFVVAFVFAPLPVRAQGPSSNIAARMAALEARVAKLEGQITAADLAGTYRVVGSQLDLDGTNPAAIQSMAISGTVTLAGNFTGSSNVTGNGINLVLGNPPSELPIQFLDTGNFNWTYANGTLSALGISFNVGAGGRVLTYSALDDDNVVVLLILTRLQ